MRSAVELAKDWRTDRILRRLEAMLIVADPGTTLIITGSGDVIEPELGLAAIGSGGSYAHSAARALLENTSLTPLEIVKNGISRYFDCFECAIHAMAPKCDHCGCRIIGHGEEAHGKIYCCSHCLRHGETAGDALVTPIIEQE